MVMGRLIRQWVERGIFSRIIASQRTFARVRGHLYRVTHNRASVGLFTPGNCCLCNRILRRNADERGKNLPADRAWDVDHKFLFGNGKSQACVGINVNVITDYMFVFNPFARFKSDLKAMLRLTH